MAGANSAFIKNVMHFFGPSVDEGMRMIKAEEAGENGLTKAVEVKQEGDAEVEDENDDGF